MDSRVYSRAVVGLLALAAWVYSPLVAAPFVYQDAVPGAVGWALPGRGLAAWTLLQTPTSALAHTGNLLLHLLNGWLVWRVAGRLVSPVAGLCSLGVFLLHPLNSESVAYVTARADLLVTLWVLCAVYAALRWLDRQGVGWLIGMGTACALAALSKEIGVIAVPLVALTALVVQRPAPALIHALWCGAGVVIGATALRLQGWLAVWDAGRLLTWPAFAGAQLIALWHLLTLAIWPVGFSVDHDIVGLGAAWSVAAGALTVLAGAIGIWAWRRVPLLAWALGWVAICVAPRFLFADVEFTSEFLTEYKLSTAMVGVSVGLGTLLAQLVPTPAPQWRERFA